RAGGGAAVALCEQGLEVQLYEARRRLGGRATSFRDPSSRELVDHCQHVSMGCCTNFADFCRRTGIAEAFHSDSRLHFFGPGGRACTLEASRWLPAPLHLAPSLWRQKYLSPGQRLSIAWTLWRLIRLRVDDDESQPAIGQWLASQGQSAEAIQRFWSVVLVSALGETLDRASLVQARKVFVDGFLAARQACRIDVPRVPLGELYGRVQDWLDRRQVAIHLGTAVKRIDGDASAVTAVELADGSRRPCDAAVVAVPWGWAPLMFSPGVLSMLPNLEAASQIECAPISGIHLWFDRQITPLPHAVLVGRLSQWLFRRDAASGTHYYQVVVSASGGRGGG
ncbi:MAG: hydroxysqualene dehydroxylase HpnE, partial [Pirellulales bacterium]